MEVREPWIKTSLWKPREYHDWGGTRFSSSNSLEIQVGGGSAGLSTQEEGTSTVFLPGGGILKKG